MTDLEVNGSKVTLVPVIKGLVRDGEMVSHLIKSGGYDCIGVSVSLEGIEGLRNFHDMEEEPLSQLEEAYVKLLKDFGNVSFPPPCYVEAVKAADVSDLKIVPLDMDDIEYTDAYCDSVNIRDMVRLSMITRKILRTKFNVSSKEAFVLDWDGRVNGIKGFRRLENKREKHIADRIKELSENSPKVLAIVDLERYEGILRCLEV